MGKRRRPKIAKLIIPPREIDFIKEDVPTGHCLLCEEWIGVNGHEHHHHNRPKEIPESNVFPKMAETPHLIVSPAADCEDEELEFPIIQEPIQEEASTEAKTTGEEEQKRVFEFPESQVEENDVKESPPPCYTPSMKVAELPPVKETSPVDNTLPDYALEEIKIEGNRKSPTEDEIELVSQSKVVSSPVLHKSTSDSKLTNIKDNPPAYDLPPLDPSIAHNKIEPLKPGQFQSHSMATLTGSGQPTKSDGSNIDYLELVQRKTRRHSMIDMMKRASNPQINGTPSHGANAFDLHKSTSKTSLLIARETDWKRDEDESMVLCVSALYGKLLVVMGMAFPIAHVFSSDVPLKFYNAFYLYLYCGSILFLIYAYLFLIRTKSLPTGPIKERLRSIKHSISTTEIHLEIPIPNGIRKLLPRRQQSEEGGNERDDRISMSSSMYKTPKYTITESSNTGSMYLKVGAVLFGVGSMIYSGLEFGKYFELRHDKSCGNILMAITPVAGMIFTFLQMYFIFLNSKVAISRHTVIARFGLMHMIGTNLCMWLNVLVKETEHEIHHLTSVRANHSHHNVLNEDNLTEEHDSSLGHPHEDAHSLVKRSSEAEHYLACRRLNFLGNVVNDAGPFLFPCTIEYSLLCAGVLYVMWKNINVSRPEKPLTDADSEISNFIARKVRHHYSVDCARASRGLFMGIFVLVLTIISLILFYVLISNDNENAKKMAILEANIVELSVYSVALFSVIVGMKQMNELEFVPESKIELDNILLLIAQGGVYIYTSFTIIGDFFSLEKHPYLSLLTAIITLVQTTLQTLFILDGSRRCCNTVEQHDRKPGREMVTFLLVCNLALWAISTFETSRADVHPTQLEFYNIWAWTIISHVSMPLAIFYRFHVTVCLGEIWKRAYKVKQEFY